MIFKFTNTFDEDEDPIFIRAEGEQEARSKFTDLVGEIPASMLKVQSVDALPGRFILYGEDCLND